MDRVPLDSADTVASMRLAGALSRLQGHRRYQEQRSLLGTADMRLLWLFRDRTARPLREIADILGLERSTVNRQVNAALASGILRRYRETGANANLVEASPKGLELLERGVEQMLRSYDTALAQFDEPDKQRLLELFDQFVDAYGRIVRDTVIQKG